MSQTFLLADDDTDDVELFQAALNDIDTTIHFEKALNGLQLLNRLLEQSATRPDIIFLDVNMPVMNGWKCLEAMKQQEELQDIPVIIYSTSDQQNEEQRAKELGALCYIKKPENYTRLKSILSIVNSHVTTGSFADLCKALHLKPI
ncbi:MAG: response regulator [Sediminibacterium sp.]